MKINELEDWVTYDIVYRIEESDKKIKFLEDKIIYDVMYRIDDIYKVINGLEKRLNDNENVISELKTQNALLKKSLDRILPIQILK